MFLVVSRVTALGAIECRPSHRAAAAVPSPTESPKVVSRPPSRASVRTPAEPSKAEACRSRRDEQHVVEWAARADRIEMRENARPDAATGRMVPEKMGTIRLNSQTPIRFQIERYPLFEQDSPT